MRKITLLLVLVLAVPVFALPRQVADDMRSNVVFLMKENQIVCSGVKVSDTSVLTAAHCPSDAKVSEDMTTLLDSSALKEDKDRDLRLLRVSGLQKKWASLANEWWVGMDIYLVGYILGQPRVISYGLLETVIPSFTYGNWKDAQVFCTGANVHPGSSGGGWFDSEGRLLAIQSFGYYDTNTLGDRGVIERVWSCGIGLDSVKAFLGGAR